MTTLALGIGDVHGHWSTVVSAVDSAGRLAGQLADVVLQVGDAEAFCSEEDLAGAVMPEKYRSMGEFSAFQPGDIPAPLFFIGGNHEPYPALDATPGPFPVAWGERTNVHYLGRCGATTLPGGLRVAFLSGIHSPRATTKLRATSPKAATYFVQADVDSTVSAARRLARVDVLVTHDWPAGLTPERPDVGNEATRHLVDVLQPTLSLHGHHHRPFETRMGTTTVHCLNAVPAASGGRAKDRHGWWRLYRFEDDGSFQQVAVAGWG